jgi:hypothetical protein
MTLKAAHGRCLLKCDLDFKNNHTFKDGTTIRLERNVENLNYRETMPVQAECIEENGVVPFGAIVLCHHNSFHPTNQVFNSLSLSGEEIASGVSIYSIPLSECFLWKTKDMKEWDGVKGYAIAERVFQPYNGIIEGILPTKIKDSLYVKTGYNKGKVVRTLKSCDYEIVFRNEEGQEERIIRFRTSYPEHNEREEVLFIDEELTKKVLKGEILVGLNENNCGIIFK